MGNLMTPGISKRMNMALEPEPRCHAGHRNRPTDSQVQMLNTATGLQAHNDP